MKGRDMKWERITISLTKEQHKILKNIADCQDSSITAVIREMINYYTINNKSLNPKEKIKELEDRVRQLEGVIKRGG
jgi:hypothetical protein